MALAYGLTRLATRFGIPAAKSAMRFMSKLRQPKNITVYRGESVVPTKSLFETRKELGAGVGRWFSDDPKLAMKFAGRGVYDWHPRAWGTMLKTGKTGYRKGIVRKLKLTKMEAEMGRRLEASLSGSKVMQPAGDYRYIIVPKHTLPRVETASIATAVANLRKMLGMYNKGGLAGILEV